MPRWQRAYLTACAGIIGYALGYVGVDYARVPRVFYHPRERELEVLTHSVDPLAMGYVGLWLWALAIGGAAAAAAWVGLGWRRREVPERVLHLVMAWALTAPAIAIAYFAWANWP